MTECAIERYYNWLGTVKEGDLILVKDRMGMEIDKVIRVTKTTIATQRHGVFSRKTGHARDKSRGWGYMWDFYTIHPYSEVEKEAIKKRKLVDNIQRFSQKQLKDLSLDSIEKIWEILRAAAFKEQVDE
jgi:hypothetical protein